MSTAIRNRVKKLATAAGFVLDARPDKGSRAPRPEVVITCARGYCWADDCHERIFEGDTMAEAWEFANESIDWLAENKERCARGVCPGWVGGACEWWQ